MTRAVLGFGICLFLSIGGGWAGADEPVVRTGESVAPAKQPAPAKAVAAGGGRRFDTEKEAVLYCVGYAHLDTQWRWDYVTTIDEFIRNTLVENFDRMEKYPDFVFNFTGAQRFQFMKEYYPAEYARLKRYIAEGRWYVSGSSVDEGDVNVPSPESVIRHVLYGIQFFQRGFGKESVDFMLPDCFGFPACLPSVLAHCGVQGFSTQKLTWGSAVGIPFNIGMWIGPDGKGVPAALNPGPYAGAIEGPVDTNQEWNDRVAENGKKYGVKADFHYYGVGDIGGAPKEKDVKNYVKGLKDHGGKMTVALTSSDQFFRDLTEEQKKRLPTYRGDLLLTEHSAGTLTSQAYMKRWNRKNEQLADAAERAAVIADHFGGAKYPTEKLTNAWFRVLGSQMHDMLPGTAIARAYPYCWNDEIIAANNFAAVLQDSIAAIAPLGLTYAEGDPILVYNPLAIEREDVVEATYEFHGDAPAAIRVFSGGTEVPSQMLKREGRRATFVFLAKVPSVGFAMYYVTGSTEAAPADAALRVSERRLENEQYVVTINDDGDVASVVDKSAGNKELLAEPARMWFTHEKPAQWPAWNMDWSDRQRQPIDCFKGPAEIRVVERGPVRVAVEVRRKARDSYLTQTIRLSAGSAGRRVEFKTEIDWQSTVCALRQAFPLTVSNSKASYNQGLGVIERGNNDPKKYEVPAHEWFDLTDAKGDYGVSVLEDCKFGSDKPADNVVRLTLLFTAGVREGYRDQHSNDWGRHDILYALYGHQGDWRDGKSEWQARRLNQPLRAFQMPLQTARQGTRHWNEAGIPLGGPQSTLDLSFVGCSTDQVDIRTIKKAVNSDEYVIRLQELFGRPAKDVRINFRDGLKSAVEIDGQERKIGEARIVSSQLSVDLTPFSPRAFAVRLAGPDDTMRLTPPTGKPVDLEFDTDVVSMDDNRGDGGFGTSGKTIPGEQLPRVLTSEGIEFRLGSGAAQQKNAVACKGQTVKLPEGDYNRLYLLAAADEDTTDAFVVGKNKQDVAVSCWTGFVGQMDCRVWDRAFGTQDFRCDGHVTSITPGYIKRDTLAWFTSHRHDPKAGNESYRYSYLFKYGLDLPSGAKEVKLPDNPKIKILAMTAAKSDHDTVRPAAPLYDDLSGRPGKIEMRHVYPKGPEVVHEGVKPIGTVTMDRKFAFKDLSIGAPSKQDYADYAGGHGVAFHFYNGNGDFPIHPGSGVKGDLLSRLNDGEVAQNDDDVKRCVWYNNEGRFYADLKKSIAIREIDTYSWHKSNRAPQFFSLWGSNGDKLPAVDFGKGAHEGWTLLGVVDTRSLEAGGIHGSAVKAEQGNLGPYRWLLWVAPDVGEGTFFTEIDVQEGK